MRYMGYRRIQGDTGKYKRIQENAGDTGDTGGYRRIQEDTGEYMRKQGVKGGYRRIQDDKE